VKDAKRQANYGLHSGREATRWLLPEAIRRMSYPPAALVPEP
jgi:hypothetical protein